MDPDQLHALINNYYAVIFPQVKHNKGIISDVVGDAMFAIWTDKEHEAQVRTNACVTALEIQSAVNRFNRAQPHQLPTRLGLHYGNFRLGNVGAAGHFEFRAVGDTVNTAARIEGLNKLLGTQILVTAEIIIGLPDFFTREIGFFILRGKNKAVHIYELVGKSDQHLLNWQAQKAKFAKALLFFQQQQWTEALNTWQDIERISPNDGPTLYYINYLKQNISFLSKQGDSDNSPTIIKI
jgi:adenylate cyclase